MEYTLDINNLSKEFAEVKAVDGLSFRVAPGEIYGFLGQNGAGKSTTIRMLLTLVRPSSGEIRIFGKDLRHHRREILQQVGAIIEKPDLYKYLTAFQNLELMARLSGCRLTKKQLQEKLDRVGIGERANSKVRTFSQGMRQRLGIACALVHDPPLVILDEPTNGLDPQGIADVRNLLLHLSREEGKTIFLSSHLLHEIELIADSMLIIDRGKKVAEGKVSDLLHPADTLVAIQAVDEEGARRLLNQSAWSRHLQPGSALVLKMDRKDIPNLLHFLVDNKVDVLALSPRHSLEDYFLSRTTENQHVATYTH
jgi:ABC-type multidrug transport system ATPase subunit